jgi:protein-disulfide isomerase
MTLGSSDAPGHIEVFTDFQCPYCKKGDDVLHDLADECGARLYIEHHNFPLDMECNPLVKRPFHEYACEAALYACCAAQQNRFWEMASLMFANNKHLRPKELDGYVEKLGLNVKKFQTCLADPPPGKSFARISNWASPRRFG